MNFTNLSLRIMLGICLCAIYSDSMAHIITYPNIDEHFLSFVSDSSPADAVYKIKKVVIDAGHGGKDSGCIGVTKSQEKDITLKIALLVGKKIKAKYPHIEVIYTRDKDVFIPLDERASIANRNRADLFISIHCNYVVGSSHHKGSETYVLGLDRKGANLEIARRENASVGYEADKGRRYNDVEWNSPEAEIIINAWQSSYFDRSHKLAGFVEEQLHNHAERKSHGVKQAGFLVLRQTTMPSILIETGFLSNADEEAFLNSEEGQATEAEAIFRAFQSYKKGLENGKITEEEENNPESIVERPSPPKQPKNEKVLVNVTEKGFVKKQNAPITFKVQIATSPTELDTSNDKKWEAVSNVEIRKEDNVLKYLAIGYDSYETAVQNAKLLHNMGFTGAFVVAYEGEERISVKTAKEKLGIK